MPFVGLFISILYFCSFSGNCQEKKSEFKLDFGQIINEVHLGVNLSVVSNGNTTNYFGGGLGIYHVWWEKKFYNLIFGIEYNYTRQYLKQLNMEEFSFAQDVDVQFHNFTFPLFMRFNFGKKIKGFCEFGGYFELPITKGKGDYYGYSKPYGTTFEENKKFPISTGVNGGPLLGLGLKIPISNNALLFRLKYHYGVRNLLKDNPGGNWFQNQYLVFSAAYNWAK